jgi:hypothetical protein
MARSSFDTGISIKSGGVRLVLQVKKCTGITINV